VYDPAEAAQKMSNWKTHLPWIRPHYAIKSCPSMELIKDLAQSGAGMDCASKFEIELAFKAGLTVDDIVYSNPVKTEKDLIWAEQMGIRLTTADTFE
jgi:ornithine decarboxylase